VLLHRVDNVAGGTLRSRLGVVAVQQVQSRSDPRHTKVGGEFGAIPDRVVPPDVKVILDVPPFVVGEQVAERRVARRNRLVPTELPSAHV